MPKVSVIIPVYGTENYIERCARYLLEQTLDDIEYLFIDDCTPDKSIDILKEVINDYPIRKQQVIVHRMEHNSGQAKVREWGINNASGEYVIHCDSDDWIDVCAYEDCYDYALKNNSDIVFFDFERTNGSTCKIINRNIKQDKDYVLRGLISGKIMGSMWGALVKRELYKSIVFYPEYNLNEDLLLFFQLFNNSNTFTYIPMPYYKYFENNNSLTAIGTKEKAISNFYQSYNNVNKLFEFIENLRLSEKYKDEIVARKYLVLELLHEYLSDKQVHKIWMGAYNGLFTKIIINKYIPKGSKFKFYLSYLFK